MSQHGMPQPQPAPDPVAEIAGAVLKVAVLAVAVLVALPLLVPLVVTAAIPPGAPTKTRFWDVPRGWRTALTLGLVVVVGLLTVEAVLLADWAAGSAREVLAGPMRSWPEVLWPQAAPWLGANLLAGLLLIPAVFAWRRRRIAQAVRDRRIPDVVTQERIESARKHAADLVAARRIGVALDARTGEVRHVSPRARTAPHGVGGRVAFGVVARPTVRTLAERLQDRRQIRDWISRDGRWLQLPHTAGAVRSLLIAESGSGKTVLLHGLIASALSQGWPVVFIDAKGDPADAAHLAARTEAAGRTVTIGRGWNLFTGTGEQIVEKLMRLLPAPDGANQHYLDEARAVLAAVQGRAPLTSVPDLQARLSDPAPHVRDRFDRDLVTAIVDPRSGTTAAARVQRALSAALRPLEPWLEPSGWSYRDLAHDLTVVPLSPADAAQARLGDLMLLDLRHALAARLAIGDRQPLLVVVDEFAQLVGSDADPGDAAAALFETARSAGAGLVLAAQSTAGLSSDDTRRARALSSGAALILGRSKDPEDVVKYAGTVMRMEASGAAAGEELRSARAQHTWVIPPQDVREAWDGAFWLIQAGAIATFRALPIAPAPSPVPASGVSPTQPEVEQASAAAPAELAPLQLPPVTKPAPPTPRVPRPRGGRGPSSSTQPAAAVLEQLAEPAEIDPAITGLEIVVRHLGDHQWLAIAYPATDELILNDLPEPLNAVFTTAQHPLQAQFGAWSDQWHPAFFTRWNPDHEPLPTSWSVVLNELVDVARRRYHL